MTKNKGFTLVELLAVIAVLIAILLIAVPTIINILESTKTSVFNNDVKIVLHQVELEIANSPVLDITTISAENITNYGLNNDNYADLGALNISGNNYIVVTGKDKWAGYKACGTSKNLKVVTINDNSNCVLPFAYTGGFQTFTVPVTGNYQIELWGAQGGSTTDATKGISIGGKGGYTKGTIALNKGQILYLYVGEGETSEFTSANVGITSLYSTNWNGGGAGAQDTSEGASIGEHGFPGGGATDIRTTSGSWNNVTSLRSRIMVAAGGGGGGWSGNGSADQYYTTGGGSGGGTSGIGAPGAASSIPGTQTTGNAFGYGGNGTWSSGGNNNGTGGGGGGYYGGREGITFAKPNSSGSGGSSFISGHVGCNAINSSGVPTGQPNHFSGLIFSSTEIINGSTSMPNPNGGTETGHPGSGYARIIFLGT